MHTTISQAYKSFLFSLKIAFEREVGFTDFQLLAVHRFFKP